MHRRFSWLLSFFVGGCVTVLVLWIMSTMVEVEPYIVRDQKARSVTQLIGTRHQCNEKITELDRAITNSKSCQLDNDCVLVMDSSLTFGQCFISVKSGKAELVNVKLREVRLNCRSSWVTACGHSVAAAICQNSICTVENFEGLPGIGLDELEKQTMKSIGENL